MMMKKKRMKWTKEKRDRLAEMYTDSKFTVDDLLEEFVGIKWPALRKEANRLGYSWNKSGIADVSLPNTSLEKPFKIKSRNYNNPKIMTINSPCIGIQQDYDKHSSLFRNALRFADMSKCDAVLITGNFFYIDIIRYSNLKPMRSRIPKIKLEKDLVDYPRVVKESLGDVNERMARGDLIFLPFREKLNHVIEMIRQSFFYEEKKIFKKPIYLNFGNIEETLAAWLTNEEVHKLTVKELSRIATEISVLKKIKAENDKNEIDNAIVIEAISQWEEYRRIYVKMSNAFDNQVHSIYNKMREFIISEIQKVADNLKFISTGTSFVQVGKNESKKIIKIVPRAQESKADTYLGKVTEKVRKSISRGKKQPNMVLVSGTNLTHTSLTISRKKKDKPETVTVAQLPTAVDSVMLKDILSRGIKKGNILFELVSNEDFSAGTIIFEWVNGFMRKTICPSIFLTNTSIFKSSKKLRASARGKNLFYYEVEGDQHHGHKFVATYEMKRSPYFKYHDQVAHDFLVDAPICGYMNVGDIVQGHNHQYEQEMHPKWLPEYEIEKKIKNRKRFLVNKGLSDKDLEKELRVFTERLLYQNAIFSGLLLSKEQIESFVRTRIKPQLKYFYNIIQRAKKAKIDTRGHLSVIVYLSGNHFQNTHIGEFTESELVRRRLIDELLKKYHDLDEEELEEMILAPMLATTAVSEGLIGVNPKAKDYDDNEVMNQDEYYYYCISGKHKQSDGSSKFADSMRPMRESIGKRGTTEPYFEGRFIIFLSGHTHYDGMTVTDSGYMLRPGSQTFSDAFGEKCNFPLNNISTQILGLPKGGPATGPSVFISLSYEDLYCYVRHPWEVDKKKLFANSVVEGEVEK